MYKNDLTIEKTSFEASEITDLHAENLSKKNTVPKEKPVYCSVVVPVFRGENTAERLFDAVKKQFDELKQSFEVIFVVDKGTKGAFEAIKELKSRYPRLIRGFRLSKNMGQHTATLCGFRHAKGSLIVTMDEDLQHNPEEINLLINKLETEEFDVVYGRPIKQKQSLFRRTASGLMRKLLVFGIPDLHRDYSPFRLIRKEVADQMVKISTTRPFLDAYIARITSNVASVTVSHYKSKAGKSSYTLRKLISEALNVFLTYSRFPTMVFTRLSLVVFAASISYTAYIILRKIIFDNLISGFATTAAFLGFGFGLTLLGLGIIGEYLYRINQNTGRKPVFIETEVE